MTNNMTLTFPVRRYFGPTLPTKGVGRDEPTLLDAENHTLH